jgi:hypothetical protein
MKEFAVLEVLFSQKAGCTEDGYYIFFIRRGSVIERRAPRRRNANNWTTTSGEISEMSVDPPDN